MNDFCFELNIDIPPLQECYDITTQLRPHKSISLEYINPKLVDFLSEYGLIPIFMECFKRKPGGKEVIHVDTYTANGEFIKLNWIYGGKNSFMNWYSPKSPDAGVKKLTIANTQFIEYLPHEVDLIATHVTENKLYLVQAGIPHAIVNPEELRYCVSCVLRKSFYNELTMNEAKTLLAKYINSN